MAATLGYVPSRHEASMTCWADCICQSRSIHCHAGWPSCLSPSRAMTAFKGVWTQDFWRCVAAEFTAVLIFVLFSLGSTISWTVAEEVERPPAPNLVLISLCFGLSIATLVQCFGHISGAHLNPAVTAAMVVTKNLSLAKAVFYLLAQCLGSVVGAAVLYGVTPESVRGGLGVTMVNTSISAGHALVVEVFITFQLVFTVFASCDPKRSDLSGSPALAIGLSVCIGHLFAIPYTGASMNPARSFGPAMVTWSWENHWVYWVAPVLGGILAASFYKYLFCPNPELKKHYSQALTREVQARPSTDLLGKQPLFTIMDMERAERKEREQEIEVSGEVLSSV
ncbi:Aquaporin-4 [Merluccius polli]|uniref:Aquaporin-4 n=1 Tax=Merluccius polli TaxID=89951 RepID=A0AA47M473_MERPO|nr:Aquaporin-4 [Merluccius polli]